MKKEEYEQKYFDDFIKKMNNKDILSFNKKNVIGMESYLNLFFNYLYYDKDKILLSAKYSNDNYNKTILQELLNLIRYEKSFYIVQAKENINNLNLDGIINERKKEQLKYYNCDYIYSQ